MPSLAGFRSPCVLQMANILSDGGRNGVPAARCQILMPLQTARGNPCSRRISALNPQATAARRHNLWRIAAAASDEPTHSRTHDAADAAYRNSTLLRQFGKKHSCSSPNAGLPDRKVLKAPGPSPAQGKIAELSRIVHRFRLPSPKAMGSARRHPGRTRPEAQASVRCFQTIRQNAPASAGRHRSLRATAACPADAALADKAITGQVFAVDERARSA